jgi:hypothetical protein
MSSAFSHQLIPDIESAPPSVKHLPLAKRIQIWADLVDTGEALVRAGLRAKIGPDGDLKEAYREWYRLRMEEHDRMQVALAENLTRCERAHGK